jgi:hypothetical protein
MKYWLNIVLGLLLGFLIGWFIWGMPSKVGATYCPGHTEWSNWNYYKDITKCQPVAECGTTEGTKTVKEKQVCMWDNGCGMWECQFGEKQYREVEVKCEVETPDCPPTEGVCETACGKFENTVPDGQGGMKFCPATPLCNTPAGAPVCTDQSVLTLPLNTQVIRAGADATIKWIPTGGDKVNIFFKELGQADWTHALGDEPNDGITEIHLLKPSIGYEFGLQQHQGCSGGQTIIVGIVDGPEPMVFYASYWVWAN